MSGILDFPRQAISPVEILVIFYKTIASNTDGNFEKCLFIEGGVKFSVFTGQKFVKEAESA